MSHAVCIALCSARLWEVRTGAAVILVAAAYMTDPTDVNLLKRCVQINSTGWIELPSSNLTQPHPADKTFEDRAAESGVYKFDRVDRGAFWFLAQPRPAASAPADKTYFEDRAAEFDLVRRIARGMQPRLPLFY